MLGGAGRVSVYDAVLRLVFWEELTAVLGICPFTSKSTGQIVSSNLAMLVSGCRLCDASRYTALPGVSIAIRIANLALTLCELGDLSPHATWIRARIPPCPEYESHRISPGWL